MTTERDIAELLSVSKIHLGKDHEDQERVVEAALRRLLINRQRGVVLADEVGFGKTYEALAVVSHLCVHAKRRRKPLPRALVLCKPALVRKWEEETSSARARRGFPQYLPDRHPAEKLFGRHVHCIDNREKARKLRSERLRGKRVDGRNQVPPGLYIVNEKLLQKEKRRTSTLLSQLWGSRWDIIVVDEAHHYARGNRPMFLFAPDGDIRNYDQPGLHFRKILALTATPFELTPHELVNLLALVRADHTKLDSIEIGLKYFVSALDRFFELRDRSPDDPLREQQVARLERLRDMDCSDGGGVNQGLQTLLRQFVIRNTKRQNERRYFLVECGDIGVHSKEFHKLDEDLQQRVRKSPLIQFEGVDTLFYLELRELIQEVTERARDGETLRTFIPTDLRQGLSSYRQIAASQLLNRDLDSARRLRALVDRWNNKGRLHPKVAALVALVRGIVDAEICRLRATPDAWFSKVLIFNKLIRGTARQLREVLADFLSDAFERFLDELLASKKSNRDDLEAKIRRAVDDQLKSAEREMKDDPAFSSWCHVPAEFTHDDFARYRGRSILKIFREPLRRRAVQTLALIDLVRSHPELDVNQIGSWVQQQFTADVIQMVRDVIDRYLDDTPHDDAVREALLDHAERDLVVALEESKSFDVAARFDGETSRDREGHRRNFNRRHNPFVLLVGQVGEEGIDLQEQCRYVIHYDLEWNPARMEQREGRVDRMGWMDGRNDAAAYIDVRFLVLKGTYEERIFHTVMQRDQWFQVLIGAKKKELGVVPDDVDQEVGQDQITDDVSVGALTEVEKEKIMVNLRPE